MKILPLFIVFSFTLYYRINLIYRDELLPPHILFIPQLSKNISKIERGPAKGIYTKTDNKIYYDELYELLYKLNNTNEKKGIFISGIATWAYISFPNLNCVAPVSWRCFFDNTQLQPYYENFPMHKFPDYVIILDKRNPSNNKDYKIEETWMMNEIKKRKYKSEKYSSGILYYFQ